MIVLVSNSSSRNSYSNNNSRIVFLSRRWWYSSSSDGNSDLFLFFFQVKIMRLIYTCSFPFFRFSLHYCFLLIRLLFVLLIFFILILIFSFSLSLSIFPSFSLIGTSCENTEQRHRYCCSNSTLVEILPFFSFSFLAGKVVRWMCVFSPLF